MRCSFHSRLKYNQHKFHIFCAYLLNQCKYYYYNITKHKNYLSYSATFCMFLLLLFPCRDFLFRCNYTGTGCYYYTGTEQCYNYIDTGLSLDGLCSKFYLFFNSFILLYFTYFPFILSNVAIFLNIMLTGKPMVTSTCMSSIIF